ncbi:MAG: CRISPR-associated protein Cas4 [Nitrososphaerota archaeon]
MFQIVALWNLARPDKDLGNFKVELRGYSKEVYLSGQFLQKLSTKEIRPLSVSDIADFLCPQRIDLYIKKGKNRPKVRGKETWGRIAGRVIENYVRDIFKKKDDHSISKYSDIINEANNMSGEFKKAKSNDLKKLDALKSRKDETPEWFLNLLTYNGRAELGFKLLHKKLFGKKEEMDLDDIEVTSCELNPDYLKIGISRGVKPDFLIEKYKIVGDVKSAIGGFRDYYLLTCTGYALAFENSKGSNKDIDFGIIYFFPTRHSEYVKPISFVQVYIFQIDDNLRQYFLDIRDQAYSIISRDSPPDFPEDTQQCNYCQYLDYCKSQGLKI